MKYFVPFLILFSLVVFSCKNNVAVKVIEERDPIVKTIEEQDSMIIIPRDSVVRKPKK